MRAGERAMKLLKIEGDQGHFRDSNGKYKPIDTITKEALLQLVTWTLNEKEVEFDVYDEKNVKNHAQQIVYKSVDQKLRTLRDRKQEFIDEAERSYLKEYEKYRDA
jgi:vacuolar-type H+-ATPase subunit I/STV1